MLARGPLTTDEAIQAKLIDHVGYADEVVAARVELEEKNGVKDARNEQRDLRVKKPAGMTANRRRQFRQQPRQKRVSA